MTAADVTLNPTAEVGLAGMTSSQYLELYDKKTNFSRPFATNLAPQAHDAIWAMALALNATEQQLIHQGRRQDILTSYCPQIILHLYYILLE